MILRNIFCRKLPKGQVVWCLGLPYTKEAFLACCGDSMKSDFINLLKFQYNSTDVEILWSYYEQTAQNIERTVRFLRDRNVEVIELSSISQLREAFSYSTIILTAHRHRFLECLDFLGNTISIEDFVKAIPKNYNGIVDISSCFSATFQMKCKQKAINATYIAAETKSSVDLRLFIYKQTIKHLISHQIGNYLDSFRAVIRRIIAESKQNKQVEEAVFLGGNSPTADYIRSDASKAKDLTQKCILPNSDVSSGLNESAEGKNVTFLPLDFCLLGRTMSVGSNSPSPIISEFPSPLGGLLGGGGIVGCIIGGMIDERLHDKRLHLDKVHSSVFAPSETKRGDYMMVQVFLYESGDEDAVASKAKEVDPIAERRNYIPLSVGLKKGDKVKIVLSAIGKYVTIEEPMQELMWQGQFTDCQFAVYVDEKISASTLLGIVQLSVNDAPVGRMMFKTRVVDNPSRLLYSNVDCKRYNKIFISYSHKDEERVKYLAEAYRTQGVDYFFDRHYLKAGDVYPLKIQQYIESADLFILCWSKNAAESDYVSLERHQALALAYPQVDIKEASITIYPLSIEPRAEYPADMSNIYNFEEV